MRQKVIVVMPAYNAAKTLERTYNDLPESIVDKVILVDDVSQDETVEIARQLGLDVVVHIQTRAMAVTRRPVISKRWRARGYRRDVAPDYQYDSTLVPELIGPIVEGKYDMMLGSRFLSGGTLAGGMPLYKFLSNRFLTIVENLVLANICPSAILDSCL